MEADGRDSRLDDVAYRCFYLVKRTQLNENAAVSRICQR